MTTPIPSKRPVGRPRKTDQDPGHALTVRFPSPLFEAVETWRGAYPGMSATAAIRVLVDHALKSPPRKTRPAVDPVGKTVVKQVRPGRTFTHEAARGAPE